MSDIILGCPTVVVTHAGRNVGSAYTPRPARERWTGRHISRAEDESISRGVPLLFVVQGYGLVGSLDDVLHYAWVPPSHGWEQYIEPAARMLCESAVEQLLWYNAGARASSYSAFLREAARRCGLRGAYIEVVEYGVLDGASIAENTEDSAQ